MIVVVEGADNAGKSTLCKRLAADLSLEVVHPGAPPANISAVVGRCIEQDYIFKHANRFNFIYDRVTCISDNVYRFNENYSRGLREFQCSLAEKDVIVIYCRPSDERLKDFSSQVKKAHKSVEVAEHAKQNVDKIIAGYDRLMFDLRRIAVTVITYNFQSETAESSYDYILKQVKEL